MPSATRRSAGGNEGMSARIATTGLALGSICSTARGVVTPGSPAGSVLRKREGPASHCYDQASVKGTYSRD
jgi:hypothetical protein